MLERVQCVLESVIVCVREYVVCLRVRTCEECVTECVVCFMVCYRIAVCVRECVVFVSMCYSVFEIMHCVLRSVREM